MSKIFHQSVLINEVLDFLKVFKAGKYIDATIGGGGVTREILQKGGRVLGIDWDEDAISFVRKKFAKEIRRKKLILAKANFVKMTEFAKKHDFLDCDGVIFDLGVSQHQLETGKRGFSFAKVGPLDMRMDKSLKITAKDLITALSAKELTRLFGRFGEEKASLIAAEIAKARLQAPIETTTQLANIIRKIVKDKKKIDPATKVFLALRAAVNFELENLQKALPAAFSVLSEGGRLLVVSFHSAEDSIVKDFFRTTPGLAILTPKPVNPEPAEILANPAARSARLRVAEKLVD